LSNEHLGSVISKKCHMVDLATILED
jgi:hypothetical protein